MSDKSRGKPVPSHAEIVIIGGGVAGASLAYRLAALGRSDTVILERGRLTCGSSWHAAGLIMQCRPSHTMMDLSHANTEFYAALEQDTGHPVGFRRCGTLAVARENERLYELKRNATIARSYDVSAEIIPPSEAGEMYPALDTSRIVGALWIPGDGYISPVDTVMSFVAGARQGGVKVFDETPVTAIGRAKSGNYQVATPEQTIECEKLVLACGLWTRDIAAGLGGCVPLNPCEHFYAVTDSLEMATPALPVLRDTDGYVYLKEETGKILVGAFEPDAKALPIENLPANPEYIELEEDWDHFAVPYMKACEIVPALEDAGIMKLMNGPESFTADGHFAIGELPGLPNCYVSAGYNSEGFEMAPGASAALAHWIVEGEPQADLIDVDVARFHPFQVNNAYTQARGAESLSEIYLMTWPNRQRESARPTRLSPLHDRVRALGACFGETLGWERTQWYAARGEAPAHEYSFHKPNWYPYTAAECEAARNNVVIFDASSFGKHLIQGRDACRLLQRLCANNVDVEPGRVVYTHMLNERGGIEADVTVNRLDENRYMVVSSAQYQPRDRHWIERGIEACEAVTLADVTSAYAVLSIQGPNSRALLQNLTNTDMSNEAFPFSHSREMELGYGRIIANRMTFIGEIGWELFIPTEFAVSVYDTIVAAGERFHLGHAGYYALEHLRMERAYREFGLDLTPDDTPYEAGLGFTVKPDKPGGFTGCEAVAKQRGQILDKKMVNVCVDEPELDLHKDELLLMNGRIVGYLRSGAYSFTLQRPLGMGYMFHSEGVSKALLENEKFEVEIACERYPAKVSFQAFFDPEGERARA